MLIVVSVRFVTLAFSIITRNWGTWSTLDLQCPVTIIPLQTIRPAPLPRTSETLPVRLSSVFLFRIRLKSDQHANTAALRSRHRAKDHGDSPCSRRFRPTRIQMWQQQQTGRTGRGSETSPPASARKACTMSTSWPEPDDVPVQVETHETGGGLVVDGSWTSSSYPIYQDPQLLSAILL